MAHSITGTAGAVTFAGSAIAGKLSKSNIKCTAKLIEDTGAGDTWVSRQTTFLDWEGSIEMLITAAAGQASSLIGQTGVFVVTHAGATVFSGAGIVDDVTADRPVGESQKLTLTVKGDGTAPTIY